ncbi:MAG: hypothetical protein ABSH50_21605 [Bryobacteraceae bacterium]|jgi:hypothetical protein
MNNAVREQLREIVLDYGLSLLQDAGRCEELLRASFVPYRLETAALLSALRECVPAELDAMRGAAQLGGTAAIAQRLSQNQGLDLGVAMWATETWAYALDVVLPVPSAGGRPDRADRTAPIEPQIPAPFQWTRRRMWMAGGILALLALGVLFSVYGHYHIPVSPSAQATPTAANNHAPPPVPEQNPFTAPVARAPVENPAAAPPAPASAPTSAEPARGSPSPITTADAHNPAARIVKSLPVSRTPVETAIPTDTKIKVRMAVAVDSNTAAVGDRFEATVVEPVVVNGMVAIPKGARAVVQSDSVKKAGRLRGGSEIKLQLVQVTVHAKSYLLVSSPYDLKNSQMGHIVARGKGVHIAAGTQLDFSLSESVSVKR